MHLLLAGVAASLCLAPSAGGDGTWPTPGGPLTGDRLVPSAGHGAHRLLGHQRVSPYVWRGLDAPAGTALTGDIDGDGDPELVILGTDPATGDWVTTAVDHDLVPLWTRRAPALTGCAAVLGDLTGDGTQEVFLSQTGAWSDGRSASIPARLQVLDGRTGEPVADWQFPPGSGLIEDAPFLLDVMFVADLDNDGWCEVGLFANGVQSRRLWLFHPRDGSILSTEHIGVEACYAALADLDGDSRREIVIGGYSSSNLRDESDRACRVLAFDSNLAPVWSSPSLGSAFTGAQVMAWPESRRGRAGVAAFVSSGGVHRTPYCAAYLLDPRTGAVVARQDLPHRVSHDFRGLRADLTRGAGPELLAATPSGGITLWHPGSPRVEALPLGSPLEDLLTAFATDLDGDGRVEIVSDSPSSGVAVSYVATYPVTFSAAFADPLPRVDQSRRRTAVPWDADGDGEAEIVVPRLSKGVAVCKLAAAGPIRVDRAAHPLAPAGSADRVDWSPDGRYAVSTDDRTARVYQRDGRALTEILRIRDARAAALSPSGTTLAAVVGGNPMPRPEMAAMAALLDTGELSLLDATATVPQVDARGAAYALNSASGAVFAGAQVVAVDIATSAEHVLLEDALAAHVAWRGEDGVLVSRLVGRSLDVGVVAPSDGVWRPLEGASAPDVDELSPLATADGQWIVLRRPRAVSLPHRAPVAMDYELWSVPAAGGAPRHLAPPGDLRAALLASRPRVHDEYIRALDQPTITRFPSWGELTTCPNSPWLVGVMTVLAAERGSEWTSLYTLPRDLWFIDASTGEFHAVTFDDANMEGSPRVDPSGEWLAYEVRDPVTEEKTGGVVRSLRGWSEATLASAYGLSWLPGGDADLTWLSGGSLWSGSVRDVPLPGPAPSRAIVFGAGSLAGALFVVLLWATGLASRLRALLAAWRLALRVASTQGRDMLFTEMLRRLAATKGAIHALKNNVLLMPCYSADGAEDPAAALSYVFEPGNAEAVQAQSRQLVSSLEQHEKHLRQDLALARDLPPKDGRALANCLRRLAASRKQLERHAARFARDAAEARQARAGESPFTESATREWTRRVRAFAGLLTAEDRAHEGLLEMVGAALEPLRLRPVIDDALRGAASRASAADVTVTLERAVSDLLYVPGNPAPLRAVIQDTLANALDSVAQVSEPAERGVSVVVADSDGQVRIEVADTGVGLSRKIADELNNGGRASTKGRARGAGFPNAVRALARYPGGSIRIDSPGPNLGARVTITFTKP